MKHHKVHLDHHLEFPSLTLVHIVLSRICVDVHWIEGARVVERTLVEAWENSCEVMLLKPSCWYVSTDLGNWHHSQWRRCWFSSNLLATEHPVRCFLARDSIVVRPSGRLVIKFISCLYFFLVSLIKHAAAEFWFWQSTCWWGLNNCCGRAV